MVTDTQADVEATSNEPTAAATGYDRSKTFKIKHRWLDGSIVDECELEIRFPTDEEMFRLYGSTETLATYDRDGDVKDTEQADSGVAATAELFAALTKGAPENFPQVEKAKVLNMTVMMADAVIATFKRGDANAPPPSETAINLSVWYGQGEDEMQTRIVLRTPSADDAKAWNSGTTKLDIVKDGKGRPASATARLNPQRIRELLYGSDLKRTEKLFLRAEGYAGEVPFDHLYVAAIELFRPNKQVGESLRQPGKAS